MAFQDPFKNLKKAKKKSTSSSIKERPTTTSGSGKAASATPSTGTRAVSPNIGIDGGTGAGDYSPQYQAAQERMLQSGTFNAATMPETFRNSLAGGQAPLGSGQAQTAFGRNFDPYAYPVVWDNPVDTLLRQYFKDEGIGTKGGTFAMAQPQVEAMKGLWMLMNTEAPGDYGQFVDYAGQAIDQGLTPGGSYYTPAEIFAAMEQQTQAGSPLEKYLANEEMSAEDQVAAYSSMLNNALSTTMPDVLRMAIMANINEHGGEYIRKGVTGKLSQPFGSYVRGKGVNPYNR